MPLIRWEPFEEMKSLFDSLIEGSPTKIGWDLAVDVYEDGNNVIAELNAPGIDPQKVDISVEHGYLKISGSREHTEEKKGKNYYSKEIRRGSFSRRVHLPSEVSSDGTTASYKNGVLRVTMPKVKGTSKQKKIQVKVEK